MVFYWSLLKKIKVYEYLKKVVSADPQYDAKKVRVAIKQLGAEPVFAPRTRGSKLRKALRVGKTSLCKE